MFRHIALVSLCGLLLPWAGTPQEKVPQKEPQKEPEQTIPRFTGGTAEVILPVTATDDKGKFISNLVASDFRVLDEGRPQHIEFFSHSEKQPIVVGFLVDQSNNMRIHWTKYQDAILEMIWGLIPGGDDHYTGYLVTYSGQAELAVNTTNDPDKLANLVRKLKPGGGAAMNDAIYRACTDRTLIKGEPYQPRRIIIIIGDGHDSASKHSTEEVLELAKRNLVTIYAISTMSFGFENPDQDVLEKLTGETGGKVEYPLNNLYKDVSGYLSHPSDDGNYALTVGTGGYAAEISAGIMRAVGGIAGDIMTQYILRYIPDVAPEAVPKQFRRIKVDLPKLPNARIRTRDGYYPFEVVQPASRGN
jgi:Ca-activated chloride channel homolog